MLIGAHVPGKAPLGEAEAVGGQCVQMFVGPPQSFKKPPPREDAEELRASKMPIYVHAPYLINVASPNNRIRIPSRKILKDAMDRASEIRAAGLIVHAGHAEDDVKRGFIRWRKVFDDVECKVPLLIENTAGGDNAMARKIDVLAQLWENLADCDVGFCFDTCHAHAAGEDLSDAVDRVLAAVGKIDLVHANSSRDAPGSGADRHANFDSGQMDPDAIVDMVKAAKAPAVICETPWTGIEKDIVWLKERL
ncbi:MAG: deoxyribonuclease IV [Actinomycetota bacterium]|nr:deoxyribonuclease IV [Actinomycetota bacterium]